MARRRTRPSAIKKMSERPQFIKMIVYGEPGTGKSVLAGTSPNALILNADGPDGPESARMHGSQADVWDIGSYADLDAAFTYLRRGDHKYDWVWFDSISLFQELGMDQIMDDLVKAKPQRDPYVPDRLQYIENMNHLSKWVRHMKALPFNFGITAHAMRIEDEDDGDVTYMPWIQGKQMPSKMCGYMSVVGRLYVGKMKGGDGKEHRILQTERAGKWYAKDRFGALGTRVIDPTIPEITEIITRRTTQRRRRRSGEDQVRRVS